MWKARRLLVVAGVAVAGLWLARAVLGAVWFRHEIGNASSGRDPVMPATAS